MTGHLVERAQLLISQGRYSDARKELAQVLAFDPNHPMALWFMALCCSEMKEKEEALRLIQQALAIQPDNDRILYSYASILARDSKYDDAKKILDNAISLNPFDADYFALYASISLNRKEYELALSKANEGLGVDPDNLGCLNLRSMALVKLDRKEEAFATIDTALDRDPENDNTHANFGWGLLEKGEHRKSLIHFQEALKINPDNEYAKAGLVEALKARYWLYRMFLKYHFWIANMKSGAQWGVILGLFIGIQLIGHISETYPTAAPFLFPLIILYMLFALSSWVTRPIANLFLRLNVYGRYALTRDQIASSNYVGAAVLLSSCGAVLFLLTGYKTAGLIFIFGFTMMIPLASMFNPPVEKQRMVLKIYAGAMAVTGILGILTAMNGEIKNIFAIIYFIEFVAYQWIVNLIISRIQ